jgi:hypothetical protein
VSDTVNKGCSIGSLTESTRGGLTVPKFLTHLEGEALHETGELFGVGQLGRRELAGDGVEVEEVILNGARLLAGGEGVAGEESAVERSERRGQEGNKLRPGSVREEKVRGVHDNIGGSHVETHSSDTVAGAVRHGGGSKLSKVHVALVDPPIQTEGITGIHGDVRRLDGGVGRKEGRRGRGEVDRLKGVGGGGTRRPGWGRGPGGVGVEGDGA